MKRFTLVVLTAACLLELADRAAAQSVRIESKALRVAVERQSGRLLEFVDRNSRQNFAPAASAVGSLWELSFEGGVNLSASNTSRCTVESLPGREPGLRLRWENFGLSQAPRLAVEVSVRLERETALSRWRFTLEQAGAMKPARIWFPRLADLPHLERERLVMPFWVGLMAQNPRQLVGSGRRGFDYPGHCSLQCVSFYSEGGPGLYLACDDTAGQRKQFGVFGQPNSGLGLELVHLPEYQASEGGNYTLPYSVVLGTTRGGWFGAAETYRSWATNQIWARQSRWKTGAVPSWVGDTALWVWNRGRSADVLAPAEALQREMKLPVSVFWHWWHGCAYDTGFPEYLPPREGERAFTDSLRRAHQQGVRALLYMNQRLWGMATASWTNENAERFAVKTKEGNVQPEIYNQFTRLPCATMCMGTEFWRRKYAGIALEALNRLEADGIYMDQACSSLACFDPAHGHALGGGTYWMNGFRRLSEQIRQGCGRQAGAVLAGEGCGENWLPYLDLMLALDVSRERYAAPDGWEAVPFFQAVYHGYTVFYGNYSSLTMPPYDDLWPAEFAPREPLKLLDRKFSPQFCLEQARAFVWGQQGTIANFQPAHLRERAEEIAYAVRLASLRRRASKYLQDGTMLRPPALDAPSRELPMSRLSIYAGQTGGLREFQKTVPLALASAWRAADGQVALVLASIAETNLTATLRFEPAAYGLPKRGKLYELGEEGRGPVGEFRRSQGEVSFELPPRGARVLEFRRD